MWGLSKRKDNLTALPFVAPFFAPAPACYLFAATAVVFWILAISSALKMRQPAWIGLLYPVAIATFGIAMARATILNLWQGGLQWRGTFYSLAEVRQNKL